MLHCVCCCWLSGPLWVPKDWNSRRRTYLLCVQTVCFARPLLALMVSTLNQITSLDSFTRQTVNMNSYDVVFVWGPTSLVPCMGCSYDGSR